MDENKPSHEDIMVRLAVLERDQKYANESLIDFKRESRDFRESATSKLDKIGADVERLNTQRTMVAGAVSALVSAAVAIGATFLRK